jgi:nucleoside-diphosphate-sugar epimerase
MALGAGRYGIGGIYVADRREPAGRIVIAGGTGYLSLNLARYLTTYGCEVILLSRRDPGKACGRRHVAWDIDELDGSSGSSADHGD